MITHLSSEQFSESISGLHRPAVARHLEDCPVCRAELAEFRQALGEFGGAVRMWAAEEADSYQANTALLTRASSDPRSRRASHQLAWALAIAAICVIASFVVPWRRGDTLERNDAMLLNQVHAQVSQTVPSSMEPLLKLVVEKQ